MKLTSHLPSSPRSDTLLALCSGVSPLKHWVWPSPGCQTRKASDQALHTLHFIKTYTGEKREATLHDVTTCLATGNVFQLLAGTYPTGSGQINPGAIMKDLYC